jgi:oxygen-independent coproporphyrinogen-3 oxidase
MMGLRLAEGIDRSRFAELTGRDALTAVDARALDVLVAADLLEVTPQLLRATAAGRQRLNTVLQRLLT